MGTPQAPTPKLFYRVAYQRLEEAEVLYKAGYYNGAVYLAGYAVECMLKTIILNSTRKSDHKTVEAEFRGQRAHQFEWLRKRYYQTNAPQFPKETNDSLVFVSTWETSLRYKPGVGNRDDSKRFMAEVTKILKWADGRI